MTIYLDTGTVLRALLGDGDPLPECGKWDRAYSSELMGIEARRAIDRLRLERGLDDDGWRMLTKHSRRGSERLA